MIQLVGIPFSRKIECCFFKITRLLNFIYLGSGNGGAQTVSPLLMALRRAKAEGRLDHLVMEDAEKDQPPLSFLGDNQTNGHIMSYSTSARNGTDLRGSSTGPNSIHSRDGKGKRVSFERQNEDGTSFDEDPFTEIELVDCFPEHFNARFACCLTRFDESAVGKCWVEIRKKCFIIVDHKFFEWFILTCILISSISLVRCFQSYLAKLPNLQSCYVTFQAFPGMSVIIDRHRLFT